MPCFYAPHLSAGMKSLLIEGEEYHHIINVFRKKEQESILLTNGRGIIAKADIASIEKKSLSLTIVSSRQIDKSKPVVAAGFSLLRNKNDLFIVEKLTELGVSEFFPFISQRTVRAKGENTIDKFRKTAISALKQCDNPHLPIIRNIESLERTVTGLKQEDYFVLAALERDAGELVSETLPEPFPPKIALLFGPEGGFSDEEISYFTENSISVFTIGNHVLRSETAAIAGVSQLLLTILKKQPDYL